GVVSARAAYLEERYEKAMELARPYAEQGNAEAQMLLGSLYTNGHGGKADTDEAARWFSRAAAQGNANAQYLYGMLLEYGDVTGASSEKARENFLAAAEQGHHPAQTELGMMFASGSGGPKDFEAAAVWFEK